MGKGNDGGGGNTGIAGNEAEEGAGEGQGGIVRACGFVRVGLGGCHCGRRGESGEGVCSHAIVIGGDQGLCMEAEEAFEVLNGSRPTVGRREG